MKKFYVVAGLTAGIWLIAFLALQSPPEPAVHTAAATDSLATAIPDINRAPSTRHDKLIFESVASRTPIQPEKTEAQKLVDTIRTALQSGGDTAWDSISQNELAQLIKLNPQAAADLARSLEPGFVREQMLRQVAHGWVDQDPTAALAWASSLTDAGDRLSSLTDVCLQMSQTDPPAAAATAMQYGLEQQPGLLQSLVQPWALKDPAAALGWADQLPAGIERDQVMTRLAFVEAQVSPTEAANLVVYEIPPGAAQEEAALSVLDQWALKHFEGAAAWASQFGDNPFHDRAEQELNGISRQLNTSSN